MKIIILILPIAFSFFSCFIPEGTSNESPISEAGPDQTVTEGDEVNFDGSGSSDPDGDDLVFFWTYGYGGTGSGVTPGHSYSTSGNYTVTLRVTDPDGLWDEDTLTVEVLEAGKIQKIADQTIVSKLWNGEIAEADIQQAKDRLQIGYGCTSHGSQLITGMTSLVAFANGGNLGSTAYSQNLFTFNATGSSGALHLFQGSGYSTGWLELDAGYYPSWINETEEFLEEATHSGYNVIMWSWCGQVSRITEQQMIDRYLNPMSAFELEYPDITFVYMTGHLDGSGENGNLHLRNEQIREYCETNDKWLYDFTDIESYDPDGNYYLNQAANDACYYDSTGDGSRDSNWAIAWQNSHTEGSDWYSCRPAHTQAINGNMKAYAAWWLFVQIAARK